MPAKKRVETAAIKKNDKAKAPVSFVELSQFTIDPESARVLPERYCRENKCLILGTLPTDRNEAILVACVDPDDGRVLDDVAQVTGRAIKPVRLPEHEIEKGIGIAFFRADKAASSSASLDLRAVEELSLHHGPLERILDEVLATAVQRRASDIHIECYEHDVDVRYRIDGVLHQAQTALSNDNIRQAISRLKVFARLDVAERRVAQDGSVRARFSADDKAPARDIEFRLSVVPGPYGEDAVLRVLDGHARTLTLDALGLVGKNAEAWTRLVQSPDGLLIVTGPTGSGKTSTIYTALQMMRNENRKILTVEDPIEQHFAKVNQKQVGPTMNYADHLRAFMRQNPDVIVVGEVRDPDTAAVALRAAQTGHLVLSTLHAGDAVRTLSRLAHLDVDADLVGSALLGVLSQRLVRKLCPACAAPLTPTPLQQELLPVLANETFKGPVGCDACAGTGYKGRIGIYELFLPDEEVADAIARETPAHTIRALARRKGMASLVDDGLDKARAGITTLAELVRVVPPRLAAEAKRA